MKIFSIFSVILVLSLFSCRGNNNGQSSQLLHSADTTTDNSESPAVEIRPYSPHFRQGGEVPIKDSDIERARELLALYHTKKNKWLKKAEELQDAVIDLDGTGGNIDDAKEDLQKAKTKAETATTQADRARWTDELNWWTNELESLKKKYVQLSNKVNRLNEECIDLAFETARVKEERSKLFFTTVPVVHADDPVPAGGYSPVYYCPHIPTLGLPNRL